jgi:hypothetical protein
MSLDFRTLWNKALPYHEFVAASREHCGLWEGIHRIAALPEWSRLLDASATPRRLLVIAEDWCGDASNTVPILAKLAETVPGLKLRVLRRDEHPDVMDQYLTDGSRSIPIVIALDDDYRELGHWGPRPRALQDWVMAKKRGIAKAELYPRVRRWYAQDRGESTIREVLQAARVPETPGLATAATRAPA